MPRDNPVKPAGNMEMLVAAIVESILEVVAAVKKLDARLTKLEKARKK